MNNQKMDFRGKIALVTLLQFISTVKLVSSSTDIDEIVVYRDFEVNFSLGIYTLNEHSTM